MVERLWRIVKVGNDYVPAPEKPMYCPICGEEVIIHDFHTHYQRDIGFYHVDIHAKCTYCGHYMTFGVPITEEEAGKLYRSKYHGKLLVREVKEILEALGRKNLAEKINERLKTWGYW